MKLRNRIGTTMAAVTLAGVAATGVLTSFQVTRTIHEEADRRLLEATSALAAEWKALGNSVVTTLTDQAQSADLRSLLGRLVSGDLPQESREIIGLARRSRSQTDLEFFQVLDADGTVLSNGHWPVYYGRPDPAGVEIVQHAGNAPASHWRTVKGQRFLALEAAQKVEIGGRVFHLVGGRAITSEKIEEMGRATGGMLYLQMTDGTRILPPGAVPQDIEHLPHARTVDYGGVLIVVGRSGPGESAGLSLYPVSQPDGRVIGRFVLRQSQARLNQLARELVWTFVWIGAACLGLAWAVGFWMARRITRPVEELAVAASRVGVGRTPGPMPQITSDEVGALVRSFEQMTADLAESRRELVRAERIGAWREIAQRLAHEIKNALSPIQISVETIQRSHHAGRSDFEEILSEGVETVRDEVEGLRSMVNEFSQFARMPELRLAPGAVGPIVEHAAALHGRNPAGVRVQFSAPAVLPEVALDAEALGRATGNIILNAVEASPAGGEVAVALSLGDGSIEMTVDDRGQGVPPEEREKVFEPYFTTKEGGTGLGLALAYKIVAEHGGRIEILDRPDGERGSRFRVVLPVYRGPAPEEE